MQRDRLHEEFPPRFVRDQIDGGKEPVPMTKWNRDFLARVTDEVQGQDLQDSGTNSHEGEHGCKMCDMTPPAVVDFVPGKRMAAAKGTGRDHYRTLLEEGNIFAMLDRPPGLHFYIPKLPFYQKEPTISQKSVCSIHKRM
jgi:hypothetical protein